jgi:hypothetical protein
MRRESFLAAEDNIRSFFNEQDQNAFTTRDLASIYSTKREEWKIANYRNYYDFLEFLNKVNILNPNKLKHLTNGSEKFIYTKPGTLSIYIGQTIKKDGYISHYTSMNYHNLTVQVPKSIYISFDKYANYKTNERELTQTSIDMAFSKSQRITSEVYRSDKDNTRYFFLQRQSKSIDVGVKSKKGIRYTDIERTLIDCVVRPGYSGGIFEVLEAFKKAKHIIDLKKLDEYLIKLDYIYPYHQLLGFYLEKSGIDRVQLSSFGEKISNYKFYITYNISNKILDEYWKIYYPNGF